VAHISSIFEENYGAKSCQ